MNKSAYQILDYWSEQSHLFASEFIEANPTQYSRVLDQSGKPFVYQIKQPIGFVLKVNNESTN